MEPHLTMAHVTPEHLEHRIRTTDGPGATAFITDSGHMANDELYEDVLRWTVAHPG